MPSPGASQYAHRYARQREGVGTFLVAWRGGRPVGSCEVRWDGCAAPEVRAAHPGCPEVNGLGVWPETLRAQGVGTALIEAAEARARERGCPYIGLGVEKNNPRAEALYKSLGFSVTVPYLDCWSYVDSEGLPHRVADACTFMLKQLSERERVHAVEGPTVPLGYPGYAGHHGHRGSFGPGRLIAEG